VRSKTDAAVRCGKINSVWLTLLTLHSCNQMDWSVERGRKAVLLLTRRVVKNLVFVSEEFRQSLSFID
jgi:hypothetical protein